MSLEVDCPHWIYMPESDVDTAHWAFVEAGTPTYPAANPVVDNMKELDLP